MTITKELSIINAIIRKENYKKVKEQDSYNWPGIDTLNLIYHVCPILGDNVWKENIFELLKRSHIFNGKKVIAIVHGKNLHEPEVVENLIADNTIKYLHIPNDYILRETATFLPLLSEVCNYQEDAATFYAHTKGNSTLDNEVGSKLWREAMYHHLLDGVHVCRHLLEKYPCVGTTILRYPEGRKTIYPSGLINGNWMFAGTFFWFRNSVIFKHPKWYIIPKDRYGAESWLSGLFPITEAATVYQPWSVSTYPQPSPYNPKTHLL